MKILIVEDDTTLNDGIALSLNTDIVLQSFCIEDAKRKFQPDIDLIILDINLPDGSGLDFCREIRKTSGVPIIFLTANDMEIDIVTGLESGADDYITKPFSLAVLRARVNVALRRKKDAEKTFKTNQFDFNFTSMIFLVNGTPIELSKTEQRLLKLLTQNAGQTLSRDFLLDRVWQGAEFVEENALSVAIRRLRSKLNDAPIKTIYGIGYVWEK